MKPLPIRHRFLRSLVWISTAGHGGVCELLRAAWLPSSARPRGLSQSDIERQSVIAAVVTRLVQAAVVCGSSVAAVACGDGPPAPDYSLAIGAGAAYTPRVGDIWYFLNEYGDTTTIETIAAPDPIACRSGMNVIWRYKKTAARAYWNPGIEGAEIDFVLHRDPDSSWRSTASVIHFPKSCVSCRGATEFTWQILDNVPPTPNGYRITPPGLRRGERVVYETLTDAKGGPGPRTYACIAPERGIVAEPGHGAQWRTEFYLGCIHADLLGARGRLGAARKL